MNTVATTRLTAALVCAIAGLAIAPAVRAGCDPDDTPNTAIHAETIELITAIPAEAESARRVVVKGETGPITLSTSGGALRGFTLSHAVAPDQSAGDNVTVEIRSEVLAEVDGKTVELEIVNGEVAGAQVDHKSIPLSRVQHNGSVVTILGEDGSNLVSMDVAMIRGGPGAHAETLRLVPSLSGLFPPTEPAEARAPRPRPTTIIGVTLGAADEAVLEYLGLAPDSVVKIEGVRDGFGADKAGLKAGDLVTSIEGISPVTYTVLQQTIGSIKPGQTVTLEIIRKGERRTVEVETNKNPAYTGEVRPQVFLSAPDANAEYNIELLTPEGWNRSEGDPRWLSDLPLIGRDGASVYRFQTEGDLAQQLDKIVRGLEVEIERLDVEDLEARVAQRLQSAFDRAHESNAEAAPGLATRLGAIEKRLDRLEVLLERLVERNESRETPRRRGTN